MDFDKQTQAWLTNPGKIKTPEDLQSVERLLKKNSVEPLSIEMTHHLGHEKIKV